ncbi:MAG: hypothetical protein DMG76_06850, partial [Acidobacteria bacterium]
MRLLDYVRGENVNIKTVLYSDFAKLLSSRVTGFWSKCFRAGSLLGKSCNAFGIGKELTGRWVFCLQAMV